MRLYGLMIQTDTSQLGLSVSVITSGSLGSDPSSLFPWVTGRGKIAHTCLKGDYNLESRFLVWPLFIVSRFLHFGLCYFR